jgi:hypothetical protein
MGVNHTRRLKPFKSFLTERYRNAGQQRALGKALNEEQSDDTVISDAASITIGGELSPNEQETMIDGFIKHIKAMSGGAYSVIALAVALE